MNGVKAAALAALLAGIALLLYGGMQGDVRITLLLIVPIVHGTGLPAALGTLLLFAAMVLWFAGTVRDARHLSEGDAGMPSGEARTGTRRSGGMVLLGPIPIVWGSDGGIRRWMVLAGIVLLALWVLAALALRR